jgi:hypothetical protein
MKHIFLLLLPVALSAQPVVSNIVVDDYNVNGGHSSFRVTWDSDVAPDNQRVQWGPTAAYGKSIYAYAPYGGAARQQILVSGLQAGVDMDGSRTVHVCPQSHNGAGWSSCTGLDQAIAIPAVPTQVHPVPPTLPVVTIIPRPSSGGCTVQTALGDLSDIQAKIDTAVANQPSACQIINITPGGSGANQGGGGHFVPYPNFPPAADADTVPTSTGVDTSTNTLTPSTAINAFANGSRVRLGGGIFGTLPTGLYEGLDYCIAGSTGMAGSSFQLQTWPACDTTVVLGTVGTFSIYVIPYPPPHSNYIQIRCDTSNLPADGIRITPQWKASGGGNQCPWMPNGTGIGAASVGALYIQSTAHHIFIGPGIDFTQASTNQADTTDPKPWPTWISTQVSTDHIAIKQNWFTGLGYPERTWRALAFEGSNFDFAENYLDKIDYWMPARTGMTLTGTSATVIDISSGSYVTGIGNCPSIGASTLTLTGAATGTAFITVLPSKCSITVTTPEGMTLNCTGCTTETGTAFPVTGTGRYSQALVASCVSSGGTWQFCTDYNGSNAGVSVDQSEGPSNITTFGPGPMRFANNYESSHSIFWHFDDSAFCCGRFNASVVPANILFSRNVFTSPDLYRNGAAGNNGLFYSNRNQWECKRCKFVQLDGNEFSGNYSDVNQGPTILINGNAAGAAGNSQNPVPSYAGDFTVTNNLIHDASGGIQIGGGNPNATGVPQLGRRFLIKNNLLYNINGWKYVAALPTHRTGAWGYCFELSFGGEDEIYDHNTCYSAGGQFSLGLLLIAKMIEGFQFTNNALYFHEDAGFHGAVADWGPGGGSSTPDCTGSGTSLTNCVFNNIYNFSNNLLIPGFTNSQTMSGDSATAPVIAAWTKPNTFIPADATVAGRIASSKWNSASASPSAWPAANLRFSTASPYIAGGHNATDGADIGVNQDVLEDALGWITNVRTLDITSTGATIAFHAPDSGTPCYVAYGTGPVGTWTPTAFDPLTWSVSPPQASASQERSIGLSGLSAKTEYFYQVWCGGTAPATTGNLRTI